MNLIGRFRKYLHHFSRAFQMQLIFLQLYKRWFTVFFSSPQNAHFGSILLSHLFLNTLVVICLVRTLYWKYLSFVAKTLVLNLGYKFRHSSSEISLPKSLLHASFAKSFGGNFFPICFQYIFLPVGLACCIFSSFVVISISCRSRSLLIFNFHLRGNATIMEQYVKGSITSPKTSLIWLYVKKFPVDIS